MPHQALLQELRALNQAKSIEQHLMDRKFAEQMNDLQKRCGVLGHQLQLTPVAGEGSICTICGVYLA